MYTNPNIAGYGTMLDRNGAMFTGLALGSYFLFAASYSNKGKKTFSYLSSAFLATVLAVPDAISQFNGLIYYYMIGDYDYPFGIAALIFLLINLYLYRKEQK
jgi:hypothetical protein